MPRTATAPAETVAYLFPHELARLRRAGIDVIDLAERLEPQLVRDLLSDVLGRLVLNVAPAA